MTKSTRFVLAASALAVIAAVVFAQSTSQSNSQSQTGRGSATASSSASGFARGGGSLSGTANGGGPWRDPSKQVFALVYAPGPSWERNKTVFEQRLVDHNKYMGDLLAMNVLLLGGPFTDSSGWLAVIQVANEDQAMQVAADDPAVRSRLMNVVVRPWTIQFERNGAGQSTTSGFELPSVGRAGGAVKSGGG